MKGTEISQLTCERSVSRRYKDGALDQEDDDWKSLKPAKKATGKWKGFTDFYLTRSALKALRKHQQVQKNERYMYEVLPPHSFAAKKTSSDEVNERDIPEEEWPQWHVADAEEWSKIEGSPAVRVLSLAESLETLKRLEATHELSRVIDSRSVRRYKPSEQIGEPPSFKSRWCVRGDQDPDACELQAYSPTVCTQNLQVILQLAASHRMPGSCGDLKSAFMQSNPLQRPAGKLYARQPKGGLPGMVPGQIIDLVAGVYGLIDGPAHWRGTFKEYITSSLQYRQSRLDPTVFSLSYDNKLEGLIIVEIDDILSFGYTEHDRRLSMLRERFKFGKFKYLQELPEGTTFNGRRIRQAMDGTISVDMGKYVEERMAPVSIERGRRSHPESPATEDERQKARGVIGSIAWAAKEGRPDLAAPASILAARMKNLKVKDLLEINKAIQSAKGKRDLTLRYFPTPPERLGWGTVTDASWANHEDGSSQGAVAIVAFDKSLLEGEVAACSIVWWKSGKLRRKVTSTLAAEAQSLNKGLGDLVWARAIYAELLDPNFDLAEFKQSIKAQAELVLQKSDADKTLRESLSVSDAKSLYDNLMKDGNQPQDKFTALDVAIARERIDGMGVQVRWVEHQSMIVDALTKLGANPATLFDVIEKSTFRLVAEGDRLEERLRRRETGQVKRR